MAAKSRLPTTATTRSSPWPSPAAWVSMPVPRITPKTNGTMRPPTTKRAMGTSPNSRREPAPYLNARYAPKPAMTRSPRMSNGCRTITIVGEMAGNVKQADRPNLRLARQDPRRPVHGPLATCGSWRLGPSATFAGDPDGRIPARRPALRRPVLVSLHVGIRSRRVRAQSGPASISDRGSHLNCASRS